MSLTVVPIHAGQANCKLYGSQVLDAAVAFLLRYGLDGNPEWLWHELANAMRDPQARTLVLGAIDEEDGRLVGHLIAELQVVHGEPIIVITQLFLDSKKMPGLSVGSVIRSGWDLVKMWASLHNVNKIRIWALDESRAKLFSKLGFQDMGFRIMTVALPPAEPKEADNGGR